MSFASARRLALPASLRSRVSLVVTAVGAILISLTGLWWGWTTHDAIHEEVEAASLVAEQWLAVVVRPHAALPPEKLVEELSEIGRLRANVLEAWRPDGTLLYRSPLPTYKAGRDAPAWFDHLIAPDFKERQIHIPGLMLVLRPDSSRSVLDAWDTLVQYAGWALAILAVLAFAAHRAIDRALAPLTALESALERTAGGDFAVRLPLHGSVELDRLARRYNHMAERLDRSLLRNTRLEEDQAFTRAVNARLEDERRALARELHDEFGQGITAVRAIAGAIAQRTGEQPQLYGSAQAILAMTGQLQDGVRVILNRLRSPRGKRIERVDLALAGYCTHWAGCYPELALEQRLAPVEHPLDEAFCLTLLRLLQESLTNVARHARARHAQVALAWDEAGLELRVSDDGCGFDSSLPSERLGLTGMRERVAECQGQIQFDTLAEGGSRVAIRLPWPETLAEEPADTSGAHA